MTKGYKTLAGHAYFFREGAAYTVPEAGTASRTAKPNATDPKWLDFGNVSLKPKNSTEVDEIMGGAPGKRVLMDVVETSAKMSIEIKCKELSNIIFELLFGAESLEAGGQYNPLEGGEVKGWLKFQQYDQKNALINTVDVYVYLKRPSDLDEGEKTVSATIEALVLWSSLNTGNLAA